MTAHELRQFMVAHDYTVRSLARELGVWPSTVQRWRDGDRKISRVAELALMGLEMV